MLTPECVSFNNEYILRNWGEKHRQLRSCVGSLDTSIKKTKTKKQKTKRRIGVWARLRVCTHAHSHITWPVAAMDSILDSRALAFCAWLTEGRALGNSEDDSCSDWFSIEIMKTPLIGQFITLIVVQFLLSAVSSVVWAYTWDLYDPVVELLS